MTKAYKIRLLYAQGKSTREIADALGCSTEYVRVCSRQRVIGGYDPNKNYERRMLEIARANGEIKEAARAAARVACAASRVAGMSIKQAAEKRFSAYTATMKRLVIERACESIRKYDTEKA